MSFLFRRVVRPLLTVSLGLVVFLAVGILTVDRLVSDKLLNADFYADVIAEQDTYNRIYDEVMLDAEVRQASAQLFPTELVSHEDLVGIFRDVAPPEYLREQAEGAIDSIIGYLREDDSGSEADDAGELRIYVDVGPALARVKPVAAAFVQRRIGDIPEEEPKDPGCSPERAVELWERYGDMAEEILAGRSPVAIPSVKALTMPCREFVFDAAFGAPELTMPFGGGLLAHAELDPRIVQGLRENEEEIRAEFVAGNMREALRAAAPVVAASVGEVLDRIPEEDSGEPGCSPERLVQAVERYAAVYQEMAAGRVPASIPSAKMLSRPCREFVLGAVFGARTLVMPFDGGLLAHAGLDSRVVRGLQDSRAQIRTEFVAGNMREALKVAAPAVVGPVLDDEIEGFRVEVLDADDRLELIDLMGEPAASETRTDAAEFRSELSRGSGLSRILGIGLLAGGALALLLVHLPDLGRGLRRVGVCLVIAGLMYLGIAKLMQFAISNRGEDLIDQAARGQTDIPESAMRLVSDLLVSFTRNLR